MNSKFLIERLEDSSEYKEFIKENPGAYFCSGFFIIDLENTETGNKYHLDYYVPESGKTFSFELEEGVRLVPLERNDEKILEKVLMERHFDFEDIEKTILREMEFNKINDKIQKMIFSLQNIEGRDLLLGTIFVSGFGLVKANFDLKERKITEFEKKSFFDMLNIFRRK